jgi:NAD(P)-dependent dehydrogenase (short-subunit alcohol dehydrogenase family)
LATAAAAIGRDVVTVEIDATDGEALRLLMALAAPIDHLVLSLASGAGAGPFRSLDLAALRAAFEGKLWAYLAAIQAALPHLAQRGSVLMVTAGSARMAAPATAGLAASNGALNAVVGPLAVELAPLRVNAVCPGIVDTPIFDRWPAELRDAYFARARRSPVGRPGRPEELAELIVAVLANGFVTGAIMDCDGGLHLRP